MVAYIGDLLFSYFAITTFLPVCQLGLDRYGSAHLITT